MAEKIIMPQLGESIAEGTIVKWLKNVGDQVAKDENILLISTDKVEAEIPSPAQGVLIEIKAQPGETVPVGTVLGFVGDASEKPKADEQPTETKEPEKETKAEKAKAEESVKEEPAEKPVPKEPEAPKAPMRATPPASAPAAPSSSAASGFLSPLVRRIMQTHQISEADLASVRGSGRDGRITKNDILAFVENRPTGAPAAAAAAPQQATTASPRVSAKPSVVIPSDQSELVQPVSTMRRVIMENMVRSRQTSAHVTTFFEIDYTNIDQVRLQHKDRFKAQEGVSLTYTSFIAAAVCIALKRHPYVNAEIREGKIAFKRDVHLGMAVAIEEPEPGLMVPVIRNADQMNIRGLSRSIHDLANRTRSRKIMPDELSGGTFTITNPGNYGAMIGTPIINQPQVAILGVGNIHKQPVVLNMGGSDVIAIRNRGLLSLSFDHRLIDGATADLFMADLKHIIENWTLAP